MKVALQPGERKIMIREGKDPKAHRLDLSFGGSNPPAFSLIRFPPSEAANNFTQGEVKPVPFQPSSKQKVKKPQQNKNPNKTTKHPFLPQTKRLRAAPRISRGLCKRRVRGGKINPPTLKPRRGKGLVPGREKGRAGGRKEMAAGISPSGKRGPQSFRKLGDRLQKRGTKCLVPGGNPEKQLASPGGGGGGEGVSAAPRPDARRGSRPSASAPPAGEVPGRRSGERPRVETQDSIFSFFLPFFRKDGVRNFFFFLEGDLEGEPSGETGLLVTVSFSLGASVSALAGEVVRPPPLLSSVLGSSSFPFTTAGGSFSGAESAGAWPPSAFLSPW